MAKILLVIGLCLVCLAGGFLAGCLVTRGIASDDFRRVDEARTKLESRVQELEGDLDAYKLELGRSGQTIAELRAEVDRLRALSDELGRIKQKIASAVREGFTGLDRIEAGLDRLEAEFGRAQEQSKSIGD